MIFPFWYKGEVVFYKSDQINVYEIIDKIRAEHKGKTIDNEQILFQGHKGLLALPSRIKLSINTDGTTIQINFYISLFESNILLLFGVLFGSFFAIYNHFEISALAYFAGVSIYFVNVIKLNSYVKLLVANFGSLSKSAEQQKLWEQQQKWIKDIKACPACGEAVNPYSEKCVNCGLFFKGKKNLKHNSTVNNTNNSELSVDYNSTTK